MVDKNNIENNIDNTSIPNSSVNAQNANPQPSSYYNNMNADYANYIRNNRYNREIKAWLTDMDGVLVHENNALPGAAEFIKALQESGKPFLVLTNNPIYTPRDLSYRLMNSGIELPEQNIWTSALATADFVSSQVPNGTAYVIGEAGLTTALHEAGYILTETDPDYVILGETRAYSFEAITTAINLINNGSKFICTNPDPTGPAPNDKTLPAAGSIAAAIQRATGKEPYFIGKPNPIMFRTAMNRIHAHSENTAMIGDRMDTDVIAGIEAGLHTFLVLTGISSMDTVEKFPYRPSTIVNGINDLIGVAKTGKLSSITQQDVHDIK